MTSPIAPPVGLPPLPGEIKLARHFREFPREMLKGPDPGASHRERVAWVEAMLELVVKTVGGAAQFPTRHPAHWAVPVPGFVLRFELQPPLFGGNAWTVFGIFEPPGVSLSPRPNLFAPEWQYIGGSPVELCTELQLHLRSLLEEPSATVPPLDPAWLLPAPGPLDRYQIVPGDGRWMIYDKERQTYLGGAAELLAARRSANSLNCTSSLAWRMSLRGARDGAAR